MREFLLGYKPQLVIGWWKLWKTLPVADWIRGAEFFRSSEFKRASFYYSRGIKKYPKHKAVACARLDFAYCLYQLNDLGIAAQELEKLVSDGSYMKDALLLLTKLQLVLGNNKNASATIKKCLSLYPDDVQVALCYAHVMYESDSPAQSMKLVKDFINTFREKLSLEDPMHVAVDTALAYYECWFGDEEVGERLLSRALASGLAPFEAIVLRGERWVEQGRVTQGREQLERACKYCPADPRPYVRLAESYLLEGELFEPEYAVQLATVACKRSNWQNQECLETLRSGYLHLEDADMVELIDSRLQSLNPRLEIKSVENTGEEFSKLKLPKHQLM